MIKFSVKNWMYRALNGCRKEYDRIVPDIRNKIGAIKADKIALGYALIALYESNTYRCRAADPDMKEHGAGNTGANCHARVFFGACELDFDLDKSQVSRLMNVVDEFGDGKGDLIDYWKPFSWSVLVEMLPLTYEQRKAIGTDWTVKKVKEYKKTLVATSQQPENEENIDFEALDAAISDESEDKYAKCKPAELRSLLRIRDKKIARLQDEIRSLREGEELAKLREQLDYFKKLAIANMASGEAAD